MLICELKYKEEILFYDHMTLFNSKYGYEFKRNQRLKLFLNFKQNKKKTLSFIKKFE